MRKGDVLADRFEIEFPSGSGGMGQVYRGRDRSSDQPVAIKVLHRTGPLEIERFSREAELLSTLTHPGIVRYIAGGATESGEPYLVMEWLEGESLSERLKRLPLNLLGEPVPRPERSRWRSGRSTGGPSSTAT